jgi:hypothetical protein
VSCRIPPKTHQPDAGQRQVASGDRSEDDGTRTRNHRIDSPVKPRCKPNPHKAVTPSADSGCSAGCSDQRSEGDIPDADLAALVAAWPTLPDPIKAAIRALVGTATGTDAAG